jgi:hypothetical protein
MEKAGNSSKKKMMTCQRQTTKAGSRWLLQGVLRTVASTMRHQVCLTLVKLLSIQPHQMLHRSSRLEQNVDPV